MQHKSSLDAANLQMEVFSRGIYNWHMCIDVRICIFAVEINVWNVWIEHIYFAPLQLVFECNWPMKTKSNQYAYRLTFMCIFSYKKPNDRHKIPSSSFFAWWTMIMN